MDRKLAAILAADVVGYSALMERDEMGTHERLKAGRKQLFEPEIARHHGRVFKLMGDGLLAEFGSVVDAVECAVGLQRGLAERNAHVPDDQRIQVRIGINLGEVIVEGEDRYGDGVNIAARLERLAEPGGICVSAKVAKEVEKKLAFGFEPMGEQRVKNIAEPVQAYRVRLEGVTPPPPRATSRRRLYAAAAAVAVLLLAGGAAVWFTQRAPVPEAVISAVPAVAEGTPSLVVLPFANLSDDKEQGYLADGITEDLTTDLARIPGLFVISRNAAFAYKGKALPPAQIAKELGVRYIVEGSTRRAGEEMRINAQLIDAATGGHVWAERFDGEWADVFSFQDTVVARIAEALGLQLRPNQIATRSIDLADGVDDPSPASVEAERPALGKPRAAPDDQSPASVEAEIPTQSTAPGGTADAAAYDAYLKGLEQLSSHWRDPLKTTRNLRTAVPTFERAIALDPAYGNAHAALAQVHWLMANGPDVLGLSYDETVAKYHRSLLAGIKHSSARAFRLAAMTSRGFDDAIANLERAVALDPSDPENYGEMASWLVAAGRTADARRYLDAAVRLDPHAAENWAGVLGMLEFSSGKFAEAAAAWEAYLAAFPNETRFHMPLASAYAHLGQPEDAARHYSQLRETLLWAKTIFPFKERADSERLAEGLRKAGAPELPRSYDPQSPDRLTADETGSLLFGRTIRFHNRSEPRRKGSVAFEADGTALMTRGNIIGAGHPVLDDRGICIWWEIDSLDCSVVYRNPNGTSATEDEYIWVNPWTSWAFSVAK